MKTGLYLGNIPIGKVAVAQVVHTSDEINLQDKTVIPTKASQKITADYNKGYVGLGEVTVNPIPAEYIETNVDYPASKNNIEKDKQAYVNGELIQGNLSILKSITLQSSPSISNNKFSLSATNATKAILDEGATIIYSEDAEELLGNALPEEVKQGVFFTSSKGLRMEGTYVEPTAPDTNENPNYVNTTIEIDKAAASTNIEQGKKAYVNGELVEGELATASSSVILTDERTISRLDETKNISIRAKTSSKAIYNEGTQIEIQIPFSLFGDATTDDVTKDKTFTSSAGFKEKGTRIDSSENNNIPSGIKAIASGTYHVGDEDISNNITIKTGLNEAPTFFILTINEKLDTRNDFQYLYQYEKIGIPYIAKNGSEKAGVSFTKVTTTETSQSDFTSSTGTLTSSSMETDITIYASNSKKLKANASYSWVAIVME